MFFRHTMSDLVVLTKAAAAHMLDTARARGLIRAIVRVGVMVGGCAGMKYRVAFTKVELADDQVSEQHGVRLLVDPFSAARLEGATIDYVQDEGLLITRPRQ